MEQQGRVWREWVLEGVADEQQECLVVSNADKRLGRCNCDQPGPMYLGCLTVAAT